MAFGTGIKKSSASLQEIQAHIHERCTTVEKLPWVNDAGETMWSSTRMRLGKMVLTNRFEMVMGAVIACNFFMIIFEADRDGSCYPEYANKFEDCPYASSKLNWLWVLNMIFLVTYTVEAFLRLSVLHLLYFYDKWNYLDLFIVCAGWTTQALNDKSNVAILRTLRLARLFRSFRIFSRIRELYLLIRGFASSCKAIFFGVIMLFAMLVGFSIMMVELVHPVNSQVQYSTCSDCSLAFRSVWWSTITLFREIIAGGSWIVSPGVIEKNPELAFIIVIIVVVISLGTMNLILSVIVERAAEARERDVTDRIQQQDEEASRMKLKLLQICATMDTDCSYSLTTDELHSAYDTIPEFRNMLTLMNISRKDLHMVYELLDRDASGSVDYQEFCEELYLMSLTDQRWALADTKHKLVHLKVTLEQQLKTVLSCFEARAESQENQLNAIALQLNKLVSSSGDLPRPSIPPLPRDLQKPVQPAIAPSLNMLSSVDDAQKPIQPAIPPSLNLLSSVDEACIFQDFGLDTGALKSPVGINTLTSHAQQMTLVQQHLAAEVQEQAAALQRQSDFIAKLCESYAHTERQSRKGSQQKVNNLFPADLEDRLKILMAQGICLGHVLASVQSKATQLGNAVDRIGELMTLLGKTSNAVGLGPSPSDAVMLNRISCM